jgi:sortase A
VDFYDGGPAAPAEEAALFAPLLELPAAPDNANGEVDADFGDPIDPGIVNGIGILTYERLDMELPVGEGVSNAQLKISVGHVPQTAAVGDTGNAVIAGHRSYTDGEHFNRLGEAEIGDVIQYASISGERMVFVVDEILEIVPGDQAAFDQPTDKSQITLYTCTPIRTASHRLLVRATRVL